MNRKVYYWERDDGAVLAVFEDALGRRHVGATTIHPPRICRDLDSIEALMHAYGDVTHKADLIRGKTWRVREAPAGPRETKT